MSKGGTGPSPVRPPAPKLSLANLKGRSTDSISIHFNAASLSALADDEDDYSILTIGTQREVPEEEKVDVAGSVMSKSAPVSEVSTPDRFNLPLDGTPTTVATDSAKLENSFGKEENGGNQVAKTSVLSGIRERLQDRIPEPLTDFIGKLEKLSGEPSPEDGRERRLRKGESFDERKLLGMKKSESLQSTKSNTSEKALTPTSSPGPSRNPSVESEVSVEPQSTPCSERSAQSEKSGHSRNNSFELVDDFFMTEPSDFDGFATTLPSTITPKPTPVQTKPTRAPKLIKTKGKSSEPISNIYKQFEDEEDYLAEDEEEFFDPCDESADDSKPDVDTGTLQTVSTNWELWTASLPSQRTSCVLAGVIAVLLLCLPTFISGILVGILLTSASVIAYHILFVPVPVERRKTTIGTSRHHSTLRPEMKISKNEEGKFKGWMNQLNSYNVEDYHITQTQSVYVQLEGKMLRLQRPKVNVAKRAMWDENISTANFVSQRHYDLTKAKIYLLPVGLVEKRRWSKKYPIVIELLKNPPPVVERKFSLQPSPVHSSPERKSSSPDRKLSLQQSSPPGSATSSPTSSFPPVPVSPTASSPDADILTDLPPPSPPPAEPDTNSKAEKNEIIYLFARTCRQKEEWFRRFEAGSQGLPLPTRMSDLLRPEYPPLPKQASTATLEALQKHRRQSSLDSPTATPVTSVPTELTPPPTVRNKQDQALYDYLVYMSHVMPEGLTSRSKVTRSGPSRTPLLCHPEALWFNALVSRCFWDFLDESYWSEFMKEKIQKKLSKIHVPYFIDELTVTGIDLGSRVPVVRRISKPYLDDQGIWVHLDVNYEGGFTMQLETKVNLMKLKKDRLMGSTSTSNPHEKRSATLDELEEDSAESSTDEDTRDENSPDNPDEGGTYTESKSKKILRLVDKITQHRYFQQATEYKYIKRAMQGVSNTRLVLTVELHKVMGTLAVNIPPPPTDRLWYGFLPSLDLVLSAKPKVGEREVSVTLVTDWIQKKLCTEFQRVLVMPNMDDLVIPLMCDHLDYLHPTESETSQSSQNPTATS